MRRDLHALADGRHDLLVVGGGIAGCAIARDAALRGWSVALIERGDFGQGATAGCYRILHGGLRHLQSLDFAGMRASIRERSFFLRALPHLASPLPCLVPARRWSLQQGRAALAIALRVNDRIGRERNRGIADPSRHIPDGRMVPAEEMRRICPFLPAEGVSGAGVFHDALLHSTLRAVLAFAEEAAQAGGTIANHVAAVALTGEGVEARDELGGGALSLRARWVVDASGPWSGWWRKTPAAPRAYSAGFQLVTRPVETAGHLVSFTTHAGKRYFAMPWRGRTVWGTADRPHAGPADAWRVTEEDIAAFLTEINGALPGLGLRREQVLSVFGGLRPAGSEISAAAASGSAELSWAAEQGGPDNLLLAVATKFTTARLLAERAVDLIAARASRPSPPPDAADRLLPGAMPHWTDFLGGLRRKHASVPHDRLVHLARLYGTAADALLADPDPDAARVRRAREEEMAMTEDDLRRRLDSD